MTIGTVGTYFTFAGNSVTTIFNVPRPFFAATDLRVYLIDNMTGVATLQILATHYTVTGEGLPDGGDVTMLTAPPTGKTLVIYRDTPFTQNLDLSDTAFWSLVSIEAAFDRAMMGLDELATRIGRAVLKPLTWLGVFNTDLPPPVAGNYLSTNDAGTAFQWRDIPAWSSSAANPLDEAGDIGDWHINTTTGDVFRKTAALTWTPILNITGPAGPPGSGGGSSFYAATGIAGTNAVTANTTPSFVAYPAAGLVTIRMPTNSGAVTLSLNGAGARAVTFANGAALAGGEFNGVAHVSLWIAATTFEIVSGV